MIQRDIEDAISEKILMGELTDGEHVKVDAEGEGPLGEFTFEGVPFTDVEKTGTETGDGAAAVVPAEPTAPAEPAESAHGETADGAEGENAGQSEA